MGIITAIMLALSSGPQQHQPPICNQDFMSFELAKRCGVTSFGRNFGSEGGSDSSGESTDGGVY